MNSQPLDPEVAEELRRSFNEEHSEEILRTARQLEPGARKELVLHVGWKGFLAGFVRGAQARK
jgi:hypothetical protein